MGNITSSEGAVAIMSEGRTKGSFGKPALTYIEECNFERRLGRSIETESNAKPLLWGKLVESRVFDLLGLEYQLVSQETVQHPTIDYWFGSPDANKFDEGRTVVDIKCPITPKSFCQLVEGLERMKSGLGAIEYVRENHKDGEKYYWQLVSNAILTQSKFAELIIYCPYKSELEAIRDMVQRLDGETLSKYYWLTNSSDDELPWIKDGGYYKNINVIRFEVPVEDKIALHQRMVEAGKLLINI